MSTNATSESVDRFSLVSSFYGPGNITAWLCSLLSLFVTWCLNAEHRDKDTISVDLIFALVIPAVAAGHGIYLMFFLKEPHLEKHTGLSQLFTSSEPAIIQKAAAAEAALNVCETFAAAAVSLAFIAMFRGHVKRILSVVIVGLLAFSTEAAIFIDTRGIGVATSNLSRPFLFNFFDAMVSILALVVFWSLVFASLLLWLPVRRNDLKQQGSQPSLSDPELEPSSGAAIGRGEVNGIADAVQDIQPLAELLRATATLALFMLSIFCTSLSMGSMTFSATGVFGFTDFMSSLDWMLRLLFFIPRSSNRMTELDQAVSASTGIIALSFSLWYAFESQKGVKTPSEKKKELDDKMKRLRQEQALTRRLTRRLRRLRRIHDKIDQTLDKEEHQLLVEARDSVIAEMSGLLGS